MNLNVYAIIAWTPPIKSFNSMSVMYRTEIINPRSSTACVISASIKLLSGYTIKAETNPPARCSISPPTLIGRG